MLRLFVFEKNPSKRALCLLALFGVSLLTSKKSSRLGRYCGKRHSLSVDVQEKAGIANQNSDFVRQASPSGHVPMITLSECVG